MERVSPYINFQGRAREALEHYQSLLGGSLNLWALSAEGAPGPAGPDDRVMEGRLFFEGGTIVGTDGHPDYPAQAGDNWAVALIGSDRERLARAFEGLAERGRVKGPLSATPWGAEVGWLTDRFGVSWMVSIERPRAAATG